MPYYLKHPDHGTHIAYTPEEVEACRKHGWKPVEETTFTEAKQPEPEQKKRGRPRKVEA